MKFATPTGSTPQAPKRVVRGVVKSRAKVKAKAKVAGTSALLGVNSGSTFFKPPGVVAASHWAQRPTQPSHPPPGRFAPRLHAPGLLPPKASGVWMKGQSVTKAKVTGKKVLKPQAVAKASVGAVVKGKGKGRQPTFAGRNFAAKQFVSNTTLPLWVQPPASQAAAWVRAPATTGTKKKRPVLRFSIPSGFAGARINTKAVVKAGAKFGARIGGRPGPLAFATKTSQPSWVSAPAAPFTKKFAPKLLPQTKFAAKSKSTVNGQWRAANQTKPHSASIKKSVTPTFTRRGSVLPTPLLKSSKKTRFHL